MVWTVQLVVVGGIVFGEVGTAGKLLPGTLGDHRHAPVWYLELKGSGLISGPGVHSIGKVGVHSDRCTQHMAVQGA
ncbi:hypothetical protein HK096_000527, partial [Nowakowskiella sp. JEL0078]